MGFPWIPSRNDDNLGDGLVVVIIQARMQVHSELHHLIVRQQEVDVVHDKVTLVPLLQSDRAVYWEGGILLARHYTGISFD